VTPGVGSEIVSEVKYTDKQDMQSIYDIFNGVGIRRNPYSQVQLLRIYIDLRNIFSSPSIRENPEEMRDIFKLKFGMRFNATRFA
jgi:hypothetical protein